MTTLKVHVSTAAECEALEYVQKNLGRKIGSHDMEAFLFLDFKEKAKPCRTANRISTSQGTDEDAAF